MLGHVPHDLCATDPALRAARLPDKPVAEHGLLRVDWCGVMIGGRKTVGIEADRIPFGNLTGYRNVPGAPVGIPVWDFYREGAEIVKRLDRTVAGWIAEGSGTEVPLIVTTRSLSWKLPYVQAAMAIILPCRSTIEGLKLWTLRAQRRSAPPSKTASLANAFRCCERLAA
ncbi:hypothetical protein [Methylorubrum aminovorans]|uniref:hypothetical protein n=1 Tax=Methylorubrum aminovorans TaxID=269069 RepID=UPI003C2AD6DC